MERLVSVVVRTAAIVRLVAVVAFATATSGCDRKVAAATWSNSCGSFGLCDPAPARPVLFDVLCDPSLASTCDHDRLEKTLAVVLARASDRPRSRVRLWMLGSSVELTDEHGELVAPTPTSKSERARATEKQRWRQDALDKFRAGVAAMFDPKHVPTSSPIAEALTKIALADGHELPREIIVVSDGREMGVANFECGRLPSDEVWLERLKGRRLLFPGALEGVTVAFSFLTQPPIGRCSVTLKRELRMRELWVSALKAAGARETRLLSGVVSWDERLASTGGSQEVAK